MYIKSNKYDYQCTNLGITKTLVLKYVNIPALTTGYNNLETDTEEGVPERARLFSLRISSHLLPIPITIPAHTVQISPNFPCKDQKEAKYSPPLVNIFSFNPSCALGNF